MSIEVALFKDGQGVEEVTADEIENRDDYDKVRKNLFCAYDDCTARIEFVPKGKRKAHFKTWPNEDHSLDCLDFFEREKKNHASKNLATSTRQLNDNHINNVLRGLVNSVAETEEEREERLAKQRQRKKKNATKDETKETEDNERVTPTTSQDATPASEGERAPIVRKRHSISSLSEDDIGNATALHEKISSIQLGEKRAIFTLVKGSKRTKVYFEENYFENSPINAGRSFSVLKRLLDEGKLLYLYCVGNVERRKEEVCLVINKQSHIRINKQVIGKFIFDATQQDIT
ncbi:hypothetical protein [Pontibacillus salipaludis]|uniref:hypothetical protein n=1 Tax=Pontibacillus salipaludis TaxID=1697394 RepID=UPI0031F19489